MPKNITMSADRDAARPTLAHPTVRTRGESLSMTLPIPATPDEPDTTCSHDDPQQVGYTTRLLVQALFPYRKPTIDKIISTTGQTRVTIYAPDGLPYGKYPRLIMAYIITETVKRHGQGLPDDEARRIPLGSSMNEFLSYMGLRSRGTGGARGTLGMLRDQLRRLTGTTIRAEKAWKSANRDSGGNMQLASSWDLWFDHQPDQQTMEPSYIELTPQFFSEIVASRIPIDLSILRSLTRPRSMDIYIWLTLRRFNLTRPLTLDWQQLKNQFGTGSPSTSAALRDFRREFRLALADVEELWPDCGATVSTEGLTLTPGQPSVPRKRPKPRALPASETGTLF